MQFTGLTLTQGFVITAASDPQFNYVTALLHGDGTNASQNNTFLDSSPNNFTVTSNGTPTQGSFSPYGSLWSNYFNGSTDYLTVPSNAAFNLANTNFTIEFWIYFNSAWVTNSYNPIQKGKVATSDFEWGVYLTGSGSNAGVISWQPNNGTGTAYNTYNSSSVNILPNTWNHVAVCVSGTTVYFFLNGVAAGTSTVSLQSFTGSGAVGITNNNAGTNTFFPGYLSNLRVVKGTAVYTSAFTPSTTPLVAITNTSLLTCQSPAFVDNSINNFTITASGTPSVQRFSPFSNYLQTPVTYSNYFNGSTGNYLSYGTSSVLALGAGSFTAECWVYLTAANATSSSVLDWRTNGGTTANIPDLYINATNFPVFEGTGGTALITSSTAITLNTWNHIAVVRSGTTITMYLNGVSVGTATSSVTFGVQTFNVNNPQSTSTTLAGFISNVRIVIGTAVYTTTFVVPITPLTAITGTSLLTCQSPTFVDNSINNFTITVNGTPYPTQTNPMGITTSTTQPYLPTVYGGAGYFNGSTDYLTYIPSTSVSFGTSNFTVEMWIYPTTTPTTPILLDARNSSTTNTWALGWGNGSASSGQLCWAGYTGSISVYDTTTSRITAGSWYHIAYCRSGTTGYLFVNGVRVATSTDNSNYNVTSPIVHIGSQYTSTLYFPGYISNLRIVNGTALYTSSFVPSLSPLAPVTNTSLLLNYINGGIYDNAMMANFITVGAAQISTSVVKYGTGSISFDGTNSGLLAPSSTTFAFGSGNFTIEFWYYPTSTSGTNPNIMCNNSGSGSFTSGQWSLYAPHSSYPNKYSLWVASYSTSAALLVSNSSISTNTWTQVCVVRSGNNWYLFLNGTLDVSTTFSGIFDNGTSNPQYIGYQPNADSGRYITGYIDDLRMTKGYARYTSSFTAPTTAFANTGNIPTPPPSIQYLLVAGGGGGGTGVYGSPSGGGGAGGLLTSTFASAFNNTYTITIGAGGSSGTQGSSSSIVGGSVSVTAIGGGAGNTYTGGTGGSGGGGGTGGGTGSYPGGAGTPGQGNNGGHAYGASGSGNASGGGGGAGAAGQNAPAYGYGGNGGVGLANPIVGSTAGQLVSTTYYLAGGGAGIQYGGTSDGTGGYGGGGNTRNAPGTVNTGGGGAGAGGSSPYTGGTGGSGVVILAYPNNFNYPVVTGSPTIVNTAGQYIITWTGTSGSISF